MKTLIIKAANKKEAAKKALQNIPEEKNIRLKDLEVEEDNGVFSMLKSKKKFKVKVNKKREINFQALREELNLNEPLNLDCNSAARWNIADYEKIKDAELIIHKSEDKMQAFVDYIPPLGLGIDLSAEDIINTLKEQNIVYGLKKDNINKIIDSDEMIEELLIAEGKSPVTGKDAELEFHFDKDDKHIGTVQEDGTIDFHDLDIVNNVEAGTKLVTKIESEPGEDGKNIEGEEISPEPPKEVALPKGENTEITEDNTLISTEQGHISYQDDKVNILTVYKVKGDVDFNTGNIDFIGSVFVEGNVTEGFEIKAEGDIQVRGNVEGAHLKSDGNIVINKNFIAKNKGEIECEGDFKTKSVQNGKVICKGDVHVKDAIMHSTVHAAGEINLTGHKGLIVGGEVRATKNVNANIIGSSLATKTTVSSGIDPHTRTRFKGAKKTLSKSKSNYLKTVKGINILNNMKEKHGELPEDKEDMLKRLQETKKDLKEKIDKNEEIVNELSDQINNATQGKIIAKRKIYPGVRIQIGSYHTDVDEVHTRTVFKVKDGELSRFGL